MSGNLSNNHGNGRMAGELERLADATRSNTDRSACHGTIPAPARSRGIGGGCRPLALEAGSFRDLIVPQDADAPLRLIFPVVTVERPDAGTTHLIPGGDGRIVVQSATARPGEFRTIAELHAGPAPVLIRHGGEGMMVETPLRGIALPLTARPGSRLGLITLERGRVALSLPDRAAPEGAISIEAAAAQAEPALIASLGGGAVPLNTGAITMQGSLYFDAPMANRGLRLQRVEIERGDIAMLTGRITASGRADFARGGASGPRTLTGSARLRNFAAMIQQLMTSGLVTAEQAMPLILIAGSLGQMSTDGTLAMDLRTAPDGLLIINDRVTALRLAR